MSPGRFRACDICDLHLLSPCSWMPTIPLFTALLLSRRRAGQAGLKMAHCRKKRAGTALFRLEPTSNLPGQVGLGAANPNTPGNAVGVRRFTPPQPAGKPFLTQVPVRQPMAVKIHGLTSCPSHSSRGSDGSFAVLACDRAMPRISTLARHRRAVRSDGIRASCVVTR
jgi:hypothetical protein